MIYEYDPSLSTSEKTHDLRDNIFESNYEMVRSVGNRISWSDEILHFFYFCFYFFN